MLTHGNLHSNVDATIIHANITQADTFLGVLPQFHSFGLTALTLIPLRVGAQAVYSARFVPRRIVQLISEHRPDIMMPGVDGYAALTALQSESRTRSIPIAMLTALSDMPAIERAIDAGATGYLTKPFSIDLLYPQIEVIVDRARNHSGQKLVDYSSML